MKKEQLTQLLCAATICIVAIACHAQDTTTLQQARFEELVDHPLFVEYREINQQRSDLTTYGLIDMKEISKVFKENYDPCDVANQLKVQHIENGEKFLDFGKSQCSDDVFKQLKRVFNKTINELWTSSSSESFLSLEEDGISIMVSDKSTMEIQSSSDGAEDIGISIV